MEGTQSQDRAALPKDVAAVIEALDACEKRAGELLASADDATLHWHAEGAWSIAQCIHHLDNANRVYLTPMRAAAAGALAAPTPRRGPIAPGFFARWFINSQEPPVKARMKAPGKIKPAPQVDRGTLWPSFQSSQEDVRRLLQDLAHLDLNAVRFRNPFIRGLRFTLGAGFLILAAHQRRHLWQAENIRRLAPEA
jgi:hypothetical protein